MADVTPETVTIVLLFYQRETCFCFDLHFVL